LVLRELDRLGRSLAKQLIVEQDFDKAGCEIEYVLGSYPDTPEGGLMKHVGASVAECERLKIAERTTRARRAIAQSGGVVSHGKTPYGYQVVQGKHEFAVNEAEAQVVRLIFEWFTQDRMTIAGVVRKLNEVGISTRSGGKWGRSVQEIRLPADRARLLRLRQPGLRQEHGIYDRRVALTAGWRAYQDNSSSRAWASFRSRVSKPSVNQP
jgi:DNA invertase Pin-like site-specific DNA recombinase